MAYSEPYDAIDEKTRDISRAITSLREELEAINWYNQRVNTTKDTELAGVMAHNRDEEIEHAVMAIEWLRRNMDKWDDELKTTFSAVVAYSEWKKPEKAAKVLLLLLFQLVI